MLIDIDEVKKDVMNRYPFFGSIVDILDYVETKNCIDYLGVPTAGTNGNTVYYNPYFLENLTPSQRTFVLAHEICHVAFDHINRGKDKDPEVWNYATDAVINAFLKKDGLELVDGVVDIPWAILYDAEEMYKKLLKKKQKNDRKKKRNKNENENQNQNGNNGDNNIVKNTGHSTHSYWNEQVQKPNDKAIKEIQKEFQQIGEKGVLKRNKKQTNKIIKKIKEIIEKITQEENNSIINGGRSSNGAGDEIVEAEVKFEDVGLAYPLINWPLVLKRPKEVVEIDWSYQNAYLEYDVVTANLEEISNRVAYETEIVLDTSGSIHDDLLRSFLRECKNILNFSKIKVGCFDVAFYGFTQIKNMKEIDEFTFVGRGGTDFKIAINAFSKNADNKIIFTDGDASMPDSDIEAIWVVFGGKKIEPKRGKVIYVDEKKLIKLNQNYYEKI